MDDDLITLGLDPVWSGPTGAALLEDCGQGRTMHILILPPNHPPAKSIFVDPSEYRTQQAAALHRYLRELCLALKPSVVAIEISDWIQKGCKQEQSVQRALDNADKLTAARMLQVTYPDDLPLPSPGGPFDGCDAASVAHLANAKRYRQQRMADVA